ncbi:MAG: hypothetical protein LWY06_20105 [Firmicutes bacterium]|nr:hypothetical protein [Bacillota bacterium]
MRGFKIQKIRGYTLIETLIACILLFVIFYIIFTFSSAYKTNYNILESRASARQAVRQVLNEISSDILNCSYVFADRVVTAQGVTYTLPAINQSSANLLIAIPETPNRGSITYTIIGYYLVKNTANTLIPNTFNLMRYEAKGITPPQADTPSTIQFTSITNGTNRLIARNLTNSFSFIVNDNGKSITVTPCATWKEIANQPPVELKFTSTFNIRNE